jgi:hypothetical protein
VTAGFLVAAALTAGMADVGTEWLRAADERFKRVHSRIGESPLSSAGRDSRVYRLTWLPPFRNARIVVVRAEVTAGGLRLDSKAVEWDYQDNFHIVFQESASVPSTVWDELREQFKAGFWAFTPEPVPAPFHDGAVWVLEGMRWGEYHRVIQHVPSNTVFRTLCTRLVRLSRLQLADGEMDLMR